MNFSRRGGVRFLSEVGELVLPLLGIHVQYTRTESDRLGYATVRLSGSPIARDLEKYAEVFTESVKC